MTTTEHILLIILTISLVIFVLVVTTAIVLFIKLLKAIRQLVDKAERVLESAETAAVLFKNASGPLAIFKLIRNISDIAKRHGGK
jgi:Na+-transporting NADH:ubiquinone oxidoreductase subunit NqrC